MNTKIHQTNAGHYVMDKDIIRSMLVEQSGELNWDKPIIEYAASHIKPGDVVVDAGASIGDHTIAYQQAVGPEGFVIAYEPYPPAFECLTQNCTGENIICYPLAVGDIPRHCGLELAHQQDFGTVFLSLNNGEGEVDVVTLDAHSAFWPKQAQGRLDFVKLDVEGMEHMALIGAREILMKHHPILLIECFRPALERYGCTPQVIFNYMEVLGYKGIEIFEKDKDWDDIYYNILVTQ